MKAILALLCAGLMPASAAETVSTGSLLREMNDVARLARWPEVSYQTLQASSHDRASKAPGQPGWFANADCSHFIREDRNGDRLEQVMMEDSGPGAIVRFWCTWFGPMDGKLNHSTNGVIRIYLDGATEPVVEGTLSELFVGQGLVGPPFAETTPPTAPGNNRAYNLYLPIPYARGCKVTYESKGRLSTVWNKGEALYYQVNYRKYPPGTAVRSFVRTDVGRFCDPAGRELTQPPQVPVGDVRRITLKPAEAMEMKFDGPRAILGLTCAFEGKPAPDVTAAVLGGVEVRLVFDGVDCARLPVGGFFAMGSRIAPYRTRCLEACADGSLSCRWVMPFARTAVVTFVNTTPETVSFTSTIATGPWDWNERSMHFHASRAPLSGTRTKAGETGARDVNFVDLAGQGRLVGDSLFITNNPDDRQGECWWGEGDEKIYVDGEAFPSHFGTGTEDYYGYAHCRPEAFSSSFHAQPYGDGNLWPKETVASQSSVNTRVRLLDDIPFTRSLRFDMELWHSKSALMDFVPTSFYYLRPAGVRGASTAK